TLQSSRDPSKLGAPVSFTAIVSPEGAGAGTPTSSVQFAIDGVAFGSAVALVNGSATSLVIDNLTLGTHSVTATYISDTSGFNSGSGSLVGGQVVHRADTNIAVATSSASSTYGQAVTFTAIVSPATAGLPMPTGTVQFRVDGVDFGPAVALVNGAATLPGITSLTAGGHTITAAYSGDALFARSTARGLAQAVSRATPTIAWSDPAAIVAGTSLGAMQLNATASVPGSFVYTPTEGRVLGAGMGQVLVVEFTPADTVNYTTATGSVRIDVVAVAPPTAERVVINDGSAQRSMVTSITIAFSESVTLDPGAIELRRRGGGPIGLRLATSQVGGKTVAVLSFTGSEIVGGSLADGRYSLVLRGDQIRNASGWALDGDADGAAGGDSVDEAIARLFGDGDGDGDGDVDTADYYDVRGAYGKAQGQVGYLDLFDFNGDGVVDRLDYDQFARRRGKRLDP
ncbi:MAG TPA: Ig-like domain-containing protein, partial [Isosphaeraceae bacterium]